MAYRNSLVVVVLAFLSLVSLDAFGKETQGKDAQGRDYWLYTPDNIDPNKTYTLVVGVHGYRGKGKGAGGYAGWVDKHPQDTTVPEKQLFCMQLLQLWTSRVPVGIRLLKDG